MEGGAVGHICERNPPKDHPCQVWFNLVQRFQRKRFKYDTLTVKLFSWESRTLLIFSVIGQRSRSPGKIFRRGDTPRFAFGLIWFSGFRGKDLNMIPWQSNYSVCHLVFSDYLVLTSKYSKAHCFLHYQCFFLEFFI
jgi:hypothetical protein